MDKGMLFVLAGLVLGCVAMTASAAEGTGAEKGYYERARAYLDTLLYSREAVTKWINGVVAYGEEYHDVLGWVHNPRTIKHGVDGSYAIYEYDEDGARRVMAYRGQPCRINTYGDSMTSCEQVNDGETWQEFLAIHIREPIRNFGIGGYSVYQSYRRMLLEEAKVGAPYIIFNVFYDDHYRNLTGWRNIRLGITQAMRAEVSSPTLPYIKSNPAKGEFIECENLCPTPASVYNLCDGNWVFETFKDNFVLKLMVARRDWLAGQPERSYGMIEALAREHGLDMTVNSGESLEEAMHTIYTQAGIFASMRIVDKMEAYAKENGKKVLYVLSYGDNIFKETLQTGKRFDQAFVDYLKEKGLPYVDTMEAHLADFARYKISAEDYAKQHWIGHYSPRGNFFQARAIKDALVAMLEPKPTPYAVHESATFESPWEGGLPPGSNADPGGTEAKK